MMDLEKLKQDIEAYKQSEQEASEIIAELKAENDRLKEEIKEVKKYQYQQEYLDKEIKEMQKALKTLAEGLNKRQILLQEIKAIANNYIKGCVDCSLIAEPYECEDCTDGGMAKLGKKIIDLITKAEEE